MILLPTVHCVPNWTICAVPRGKRQSPVASVPSRLGPILATASWPTWQVQAMPIAAARPVGAPGA